MDLRAIMQLKQAWTTFTANHPKIPGFVDTIKSKQFVPGTEIAVAIRYPDGSEAKTGIRVKASDLELLTTLQNLGGRS